MEDDVVFSSRVFSKKCSRKSTVIFFYQYFYFLAKNLAYVQNRKEAFFVGINVFLRVKKVAILQKQTNQRQWVVTFSALITTFIVSNVWIMKDNIVYIYISLVIKFWINYNRKKKIKKRLSAHFLYLLKWVLQKKIPFTLSVHCMKFLRTLK